MPRDAGDPWASEPSDDQRDDFARLYSGNARRLYGFIMTLVFNHQDAEEVFQNTSVVLWDKFDEFTPGSNFLAWASRIAYFEVLNLAKQKRRARIVSDDTLGLLADEALALVEESNSRQEALEDCLANLSVADRKLVQERYYFQRPPKQIAALQRRSVDSVYRALNRIHGVLLRCVERKLSREDL